MLTLGKFTNIIFHGANYEPLVEPCQEGRELIEDQIDLLIKENLIAEKCDDLSTHFTLSYTQKELGITKKVKLLRSNKNIDIVAEVSAIEGTPTRDVKVRVILLDDKHNFSVEHEVLVLSAADVNESGVICQIKRMLSDIPYYVSRLVHDL